MAEPVAHAADSSPRLLGHQLGRKWAQSMCRLADALQATLYGITHHCIIVESGAVDAGEIDLEPLGVLDDVG